MSLFDPYSHARILELREEELARKARARQRLSREFAADRDVRTILSDGAANLSRRLSRPGKSGRAARPAFDS